MVKSLNDTIILSRRTDFSTKYEQILVFLLGWLILEITQSIRVDLFYQIRVAGWLCTINTEVSKHRRL